MDTAYFTRQVTMNWRLWLYSLVAAFIGGGASAVTSAGGLWLAHASHIDVPVLNFKAAGIVFLSSGAFHVLTYLQKSPLPNAGPPPPNQSQPQSPTLQPPQVS